MKKSKSPKTKTEYWYSIITPVKDDFRIEKLIKSLSRHNEFNKVEFIVVFNGATVNFVERIKGLLKGYKNCKTIVLARASVAGAINKGIKCSKSKKVVIIDSDCVILGPYIKNMHKALQERNVVNGKILFTGKSWFSRLTAKLRTHIYGQQSSHFYAPNLGIDKKVFEDCGYFNTKLRYGFDSEFSCRALRRGYSSFFANKAIVSHSCHTNIKREIVIWYHYGRARALRFLSGCFGKQDIKNLLKCLLTPRVFYLREGLVYNLFALFYLTTRNIGLVTSLVSKRYD